MNRRTIGRPVSLQGVGLHLGAECRLSFRPAVSGAGIFFRRADLADRPTIPALAERAVLSERQTQLGEDPVAVHTVEHVLAAVAGMGIDDVEIELDAAEPPIMDGSSAPFVEALARVATPWQRVVHKLGWFKKWHFLQSTPAEMILVKSFLRDAHHQLKASKVVVGIPSSDVIIAADYEQLARLMVITTLRYTEVDDANKVSADLFTIEDGAITGMVLNTLLPDGPAETTEVDRVLRVGPDAEFHVTAGQDQETLFELADHFVGFAVKEWAQDPQFSGRCTVFVTAPDEIQPTLDDLASTLVAATEASGCGERLTFRVERVPC